MTGFASAVPYVIGTLGMVVWGGVSPIAWASGAGTALCVPLRDRRPRGGRATLGTWWSLLGLSIATIGFYGMKPSFWPMPSLFLTGTAAAAGIAWINALGNLAGTVTPFIVGTIKDITGSFSGGLYALAKFALLAAIVTLIAVPERRQRARLANGIRNLGIGDDEGHPKAPSHESFANVTWLHRVDEEMPSALFYRTESSSRAAAMPSLVPDTPAGSGTRDRSPTRPSKPSNNGDHAGPLVRIRLPPGEGPART